MSFRAESEMNGPITAVSGVYNSENTFTTWSKSGIKAKLYWFYAEPGAVLHNMPIFHSSCSK